MRAKCCGCTEAFQASRAGSIPVARLFSHGEWRSLVAHPAGGRAVAGSNPVSPITRSLDAGGRGGGPGARRLALGSRFRPVPALSASSGGEASSGGTAHETAHAGGRGRSEPGIARAGPPTRASHVLTSPALASRTFEPTGSPVGSTSHARTQVAPGTPSWLPEAKLAGLSRRRKDAGGLTANERAMARLLCCRRSLALARIKWLSSCVLATVWVQAIDRQFTSLPIYSMKAGRRLRDSRP
jgi:hypothetical protein